MDLRPRNKDKELAHPSFKHTAKTRIEQVYDALSRRTSTVIATKEILDPNTVRRIRGYSVLAMSPNTEASEFNSTLAATGRATIKQKSPIGKLPELVRPQDLIPKLHEKTHFKAATSVFLDHKGSLRHQETHETGKHIEKMLNDFHVKRNLQDIMDKTSKHVSKLRENHKQQSPADCYYQRAKSVGKTDRIGAAMNRSIDFNDRLSSGLDRTNTSATGSITDNSSPFAAACIKASLRQNCPVENNPLRELMEEEGKNLSPSQVTKEMLYNCRVMRRKDFNVTALKAGTGSQ